MFSRGRRKLFSLIEILIVISILALLAAIAVFLRSGLDIIKEEELKERFLDLTQSARLTAQLQGAQQSLEFNRNDKEQEVDL